MFLLALLPATLAAQNFVYSNDGNPDPGKNTVSIFSVAANGVLGPNSSCPSIGTAGTDGGGGFYASNRIIVVGDYVYTANAGSNNISIFSVNPTSGCLTLMGAPVATNGTAGNNGMSLAATPNGTYLYAGSAQSQNITVFKIVSGALSQVGSPVPAGGEPAGMKVSPDGKYLVAALPEGTSGTLNKIAVFNINSTTGALTAVTGSPFASKGADVSGVDMNCASTELFVGNSTFGATQVDVFNFPPSGGSMTEISGSPFSGATSPNIQNSSVVTLSPDGSELFASNQFSNSITVFTVGSGGSLALVSGSPFADGVGGIPSGLATNQSGTFLYSANMSGGTVSSLNIGTGGVLSTTTGSPLSDPNSNGLESLVAYPAATCSSSADPAFASFSAKLDISPTGFDLNGIFAAGSGGSINVPGNPVTVQVGPSYSFTIPAGSFHQLARGHFAGGYVFSGTIGGAAIQVQIDVLQGGSYQIKVDASGVDLSSLSNPVSVTVTIGNDTGTNQTNADFE